MIILNNDKVILEQKDLLALNENMSLSIALETVIINSENDLEEWNVDLMNESELLSENLRADFILKSLNALNCTILNQVSIAINK